MAKAAAKETTQNPTFAEYWTKGIAVLPEYTDFKWSILYLENYKLTDEELLEFDLESDKNCVLVTGSPSNIICIDVDICTDEQLKKVIELLGDSPCKKFGSKGLSIFYRYNNERNENWSKNGILHVELLSTGRRTTIPPSLHRKTGKEYIWTEQPLIDCYNKLPLLPKDYSEKLNSLFSIIKEPPREYQTRHYDIKPTYAEACKALSYCNSNCSNDDWVKILMAFKSEVGDAGYEEADRWSSNGKSYDKNSFRNRWRSFNGHSIGYGTLVFYAKQEGYEPPQKEIKPQAESINPKDYTKLRLMAEAKKIEESETIPDIITDAPPMIYEFTRWIYQTAVFPQPILSLGAAITTIGFLMGRDFACAKSGIKANLYNICIAGSQEGKEHIKKCCQKIMRDFGLLKHYHTSWTSGAAIENVLAETDGQAYYVTDEMGILMNHLVGKYTNANQQDAISILLRLYTENYYKGKGYAKSAERKPVEIHNPFVSICGFTQREPFFEAMSSMQAHTGVLNRMCLFKSPDIRPKRNELYDIEHTKIIPDDLKNNLSDLQQSIEYLKVGKSHQSVTKYVPYTAGALSMLKQINLDIDERFRRSQLDGETLHLIIGRNGEVIEKLALIGSGGKIIDEEVLNWAKRVVEYSTGIMLESSKEIVDNEYERKKFKFLGFLKQKGGAATLTEIGNGLRIFSNRNDKITMIQDLEESGRIKRTVEGNKTIYELLT